MIVLGIQFGHDASIAVLRDGVPLVVYEKERYCRVKYAIGIDAADVLAALSYCGLRPEDVDYCSVTSTQTIEYLFFDPELLSFRVEDNGDERLAASFDWRADVFGRPAPVGAVAHEFALRERGERGPFWDYLAHYRDRDLLAVPSHRWIEMFSWDARWDEARDLEAIGAADYRDRIDRRSTSGFHVPLVVTFFGREIPGILVSHHYAHAAAAFFESGFDDAGILTHDGGSDEFGPGYLGGMLYYGRGTTVYPLTPHYLTLGPLYDTVSDALRLGSAGKTMGLSSYGVPALLERDQIGNAYTEPGADRRGRDAFVGRCLDRADALGYDLAPLGVAERMTERINADLAASLQSAFEKTMLAAARALHALLKNSGVASDRLCLSGGANLNCPSNTLVHDAGPFRATFVPPACHDGGISLGSAYVLYHCLLGMPRPAEVPPATAYRGFDYSAEAIRDAFAPFGDRLEMHAVDDAAADAARVLCDDGTVAWFEGRSEIGPRALGHRSILADPRRLENWRRLNAIKERELWRPFAPMVLASEARRWFAGGPERSPFMLYNARVVGEGLPAITHVDGTARIQTVEPEDGAIHAVLENFFALSGAPVLLNTSFNGKGEPIVQSPADALRFFAASTLTALYLDGFKITRRS